MLEMDEDIRHFREKMFYWHLSNSFYRGCYADRGYATVCLLSVVCDVQLPRSHRVEYFEHNFTADSLKVIYARADPNMGNLVQLEQPKIRVQ